MSVEHVAYVLNDGYYQPAAKSALLVAIVLAETTNKDSGTCFPSIEYIAKRARTSVRGAQEALRVLETDGKLSVEPNAGVNGTNKYRLLTPATVAPPPPQRSAEPPQPLHHPPQRSGAPLHPNRKEPYPPSPTGCPDENSFVEYFLPRFVSYPDFPADSYLRKRHSDFASVGWKKGSRPIENWHALESALVQQYQQDRNENLLGGNPNAPRNGHHRPALKEERYKIV